MSDVVVVDTNLLLLIVVGSADRDLIASHKRLTDYSASDFDAVRGLIAEFSDFVIVPNIVTEASNLAKWIGGPARRHVSQALRRLIESTPEHYVPSLLGVQREEFLDLGLTDAVLLSLCALEIEGLDPTLLTVDEELFNRASSNGFSVIDYRQLR